MFHCQEITPLPDLLSLHQFKPDTYPYLLASNTSGEVNTRYSILMSYPEEILTQGMDDADILTRIKTDLINNEIHSELPFIGGWFVFLGYEYASRVEPSVQFYTEKPELPIAFISRIPAAVIIDHRENSCTIVATKNRRELIRQIRSDIEEATDFNPQQISKAKIVEEDPDIYRAQLGKIHQYIKDGDIFQANLSRLWNVKFNQVCNPLDIYHQLSHSNPAPFAALIKYKNHYIISSSPERLISVEEGCAETRPIAGTYPRGSNPEEDRELSAKLLQHPKERAEHVMLIDLERNDLGRVCQPGSIRVKEKMILETYQYVHHIVSSISGELKQEQCVKDVIHAVFPGGTITGCPKVRCMQIISELEQAARGAYTGSLGYVSDHGKMDLNILIRTMTMINNKLSFRAGAGIVSDSIAEKELNETRHKARGMIHAVQPDY